MKKQKLFVPRARSLRTHRTKVSGIQDNHTGRVWLQAERVVRFRYSWGGAGS